MRRDRYFCRRDAAPAYRSGTPLDVDSSVALSRLQPARKRFVSTTGQFSIEFGTILCLSRRQTRMETGYKKDGTGETDIEVTLLFVAKTQFSRNFIEQQRIRTSHRSISLSNECPCRSIDCKNLTQALRKWRKFSRKSWERLIFLFCY